MKPFGREKNIKGCGKWKTDCHPKKLGKGWYNWWEDFDTIIPRPTMKHNLRKEVEKEIDENV